MLLPSLPIVESLELLPKPEVARAIWDRIASLLRQRDAAGDDVPNGDLARDPATYPTA